MKEGDRIAKISWCVADIQVALKDGGYAPSSKNVEILLKNYLAKSLEDRSIETGWEIIESVIWGVDYLLDKDKGDDSDIL